MKLPPPKIHDILNRLGLTYQEYVHEPFFTCADAEAFQAAHPQAAGCKNLLLRNGDKSAYYLFILTSKRRADLRQLQKQLHETKLSFASEAELLDLLGLTPGSVSPFGLIHDTDQRVQVVLEQSLAEAEYLSFHPNINTATLIISTADFLVFLKAYAPKYRVLELI